MQTLGLKEWNKYPEAKQMFEELEEGYDKSSEHHKNARKMAKDYDGKATFHPNGHAEVRMRSIVHGHSTVNPQGTTLMSGEDLAKRASKEHGKGKVQGNVVDRARRLHEDASNKFVVVDNLRSVICFVTNNLICINPTPRLDAT